MRQLHGDADMTEGPIWKQLIGFSVPMAIGLIFQQLYNTVDTIVVGRFVGKAALAAVGSTSSIINMLVGFCSGLSAGAGVIISQRYGAHDDRKLHDAVHTTMLLTLILCAAATTLGLVIVRPMLQLMQTPEDVLPEAQEYLMIYFAGISGLLLYNMGSGILRAVGDSRRPLYFLCFSAVINTVGDLLFVIVFHLGVAGVAWATILSQALSSLLVMVVLTHTTAPYGVHLRDLCIRREMLLSILKVGLPSGVQQAITSFSNVFVQSYINAFGSSCMAGWTSYGKLDVFVLIPVQSLALASTTFVGQNYGAGKLRRARDGIRQSLCMALAVTALLTVGMLFCKRPLLSMFSDDAEIIAYGARFITLICPFYITICFNQIYSGALRGVGNARTPMLIMLFSFVVFRQIYLYINRLLGDSFIGVALGYPMGWVMCSLLITLFYFRSKLCRAPADSASEPVSSAPQ